MSPQGTVSYISTAYGGRTSDRFLTEHCGMLKNLLPEDILMADRGFGIAESAAIYFAEVQIPAVTKGIKQLSPLDVGKTRKIATGRIHVERVIGLLRRKYKILQGTLPTDFLMTVDGMGLCSLDKIVTVCSCLLTLRDSIVPFD